MKRRRWFALMGALNILAGSPAVFSKPLELPPQKILIALPSMTATRKTVNETSSLQSAVGFAAEYSLFLRPDLALIGQFGMNLAEGNQGTLFLGGAGGIGYYFMGGANLEYADANIKTIAKSGLNLFGILAFASKQFDFTSLPKATKSDPSVADKPDAKGGTKGNIVGLALGFGAEYPIQFDLYGGVRYQIFQSFSATDQPDINGNEIWLSLGFIF